MKSNNFLLHSNRKTHKKQVVRIWYLPFDQKKKDFPCGSPSFFAPSRCVDLDTVALATWVRISHPKIWKFAFKAKGADIFAAGENPTVIRFSEGRHLELSPQGVLRRLENIVVCHCLRKSAALHTRYFLRARRRKQLSTVSYSLTRRFDQKSRIFLIRLFLFCRSRRGREPTSRIFTMLALGSLLIFVRILPARELGSHSPRRARSETAREYKKTTECCFPSSVTESQREQARL